MYVAGATTRDIQEATGLESGTLYFWIDGGPKRDGNADSPRLLPPLDRRRPAARKKHRTIERAALVGRLMRAAERQVQEIEDRIGRTENDDSERDARALAVLARTLRELTALDALHRGNEGKKTARSHDEPFPRDVGELRRSLAQKLEKIIARREG